LKEHFYNLLPAVMLLLVLSGCDKEANLPKDMYNIKECQEELLDANDFRQEGSVDHIVVKKSERKMYLYDKKGEVKGMFPVSLGKNPVGQKQQQGDGRTPEGEFFIHRKLCSGKYFRSLCISYPRPEDIESARKRGVSPGGDVTIHAQPKWNADGHGDTYTLGDEQCNARALVCCQGRRTCNHSVRRGQHRKIYAKTDR